MSLLPFWKRADATAWSSDGIESMASWMWSMPS